MEKLIISVLIVVVFIIYKLFSKAEKRNTARKLTHFLKNQESFTIDFDQVNVEGFMFRENVEVDLYDRELSSYNDEIYLSIEPFDFKGKYHKNKNVSKFSSQLTTTFNYRGSEYKYIVSGLPINEITFRMRIYQQKHLTIYVFKDNGAQVKSTLRTANNSTDFNLMMGNYFFVDLRFLNEKGIGVIKLGICKTN